MYISIQYVKIDTSNTTNTYVESMLEKIQRKYSWVLDTHVYFKKNNNQDNFDKICEIEMHIPGKPIFSRACEIDFRVAFRKALTEIEQQLENKKQLMKSHL